MMKRLIVVSGPVSSGKSTLAQGLSARFGFEVRRTKDWLKRRARDTGSPGRGELQRYGDQSDAETGGERVGGGLKQGPALLINVTVTRGSPGTLEQGASPSAGFS